MTQEQIRKRQDECLEALNLSINGNREWRLFAKVLRWADEHPFKNSK